MSRRLQLVLIVITLALVLAGCAAEANPAQGQPAPDGEVAGFWLGLWQGLIIPVTFIISLFDDDVNIYEVFNNGNWYNFGFVLGVMIILGGSHGSGRAARGRRA